MIPRFLIQAALAALAVTAAAPGAGWAETPVPATSVAGPFPTATGLLRCLARQHVVLTSGHRAGPEPGYPENAVETAGHTLAQAPMLIEMDARTTRDGVLVFMHDKTLDRTTTGAGDIGDHTLAEIKALRLEDDDGRVTGFTVPTLAETLEFMRGRGVLAIDVKEDASLPAIAEAVRAADARPFVLINLYRPSQAMILHRIDPTLSLILPVSSLSDLEVLKAVGVDLDQVSAWTGLDGIDERAPELWAALHRIDMPVMFATLFVTDKEIERTGGVDILNELANEGVDIIPSDHHQQVFSVLDARHSVREGLASCGASTTWSENRER